MSLRSSPGTARREGPRSIWMVAVLFAFGLAVTPPADAQSAPLWTGSARSSGFVTMKDRTRLAVDWWVPTGYQGAGPAPTKFPVVFRYTPYGRSFLDPKTGQVPGDAFFLQRGYAYVSADMRGTGASFGWINLMDPRTRDDGKELVDWIAAQPWSDGTVGMRGGSYEGWSQLAIASKAPKALKAIAPEVAGWDGFLMHPGGIYSSAFMQTWTAVTWHTNRSATFAGFPIPPTPPVVDEDGDGDLRDEIPVDLNGNGYFSDDYRWPLDRGPEPKYPDGVRRKQHLYLAAVLQHLTDPAGAPGTWDGDPVTGAMRFWDTRRPGDGLTAPDLNWAWLPDVMRSRVPILTLAGWFDAFVQASAQVHATTRVSNFGRMVARPMYHQGVSPAFAASIGADSAPGAMPRIGREEELRWFDRWLKGIDNGVDKEPPVRLFVMNAGWRNEAVWPPNAVDTTLFLVGRGTLAGRPAVPGKDRLRADLTAYSAWAPDFPADPVASVQTALGRTPTPIAAYRRNRHFMFGVPDGPPVRNALEKTSFVYTSAPLARDTDVIGHPVVRIWAAATAPDADFYFYLEDVAPDGTAVLVTDYQHRAGFKNLRDPDSVIPNNPGVTVLPRLPWHGFRQADYDPKVFADDFPQEIVTALNPTAWRFRKGHAIRLAIANADWPSFELHPALSPSNRPGARDNVAPEVEVHFGGAYRSRIDLPIVR